MTLFTLASCEYAIVSYVTVHGHRNELMFFTSTFNVLGAVAWLEACPIGMQAAPSSIPMPGTFFPGDLVMKKKSTTILPLPLIQEEQLSVTGERMCTKYW